MKKIVLLTISYTIMVAHSQTTSNVSSYFVEAYDANGKTFTEKNKNAIEGTPMVSESWGIGYIVLKNGFKLDQVELQFNLLDNSPYFRKNNIVYGFVDSLQEIKYSIKEKDQDKLLLFRNGYPSQGKRTGSSFYQVLADGDNFQLLKYSYKTIVEKYEYNGPLKKQYKQWDELYFFDVKNSNFYRIKKGKNSFIKDVPGYSTAINQFVQARNNKLHSEKEIIELVDFLNQQSAEKRKPF